MAHLLRSLAAGIALAALTSPAVAHAGARPGPLIYATDGAQIVALPPTPNATPRVILESGANKYFTPEASPDGRTLLYVAAQSIRTMPIDGGEPATVYTAPNEDTNLAAPTWRPDGKAYAFIRFTRTADRVRGDIVIRTLGNEESVIPIPNEGIASRLSWNPDMTELAVSWSSTSFDRISLVDIASGVFSPLRPQDNANQFIKDTEPDFSPDGKSIVFHQWEYLPVGTTSQDRIIVMPVEADGPAERTLAVASDEHFRGPSFSPDGSQIAWTVSGSRTGEGTPGTDTVIANADGSGKTVLQRTYYPDSPASGAIDWATAVEPATEGRIFFNRTGQVWRINADGSEPTALVDGSEVSVSADGTRIAYIADGEVYTATPSGKGVHRVTTNSVREWYPAMSPDGTKVAFSRVSEYGAWEIWTANADGTGSEKQLTMTAGRDQDAAWSPDGKTIAFSSGSGSSGLPDLRLVAADGSESAYGIFVKGRYPAFSPDGTKLLYTGVSGSAAQIYETTATIGGGIRQITTDASGARRASYSPDGSAFVFQSDGGGLYKVFADGTGKTRLTTQYDQEPAWGPLPQPPKAAIANLTIDEGASATATVTLNKVGEEDAVVRVIARPGTATATDFGAIDQTVTIPAGQLAATFPVTTADDTTDEPDETFTLGMTAVSNVTAGPAATVTITDNDEPPVLSITDVEMDEGDLGFTDAVFTLRLSEPSGWTVKARAATVDGTAIAPDDFTAVDQALTWAPGEVVKEVRVPIFGDTQPEADELFTLALDQLEHVVGPARAARATLRNDDTDGELPDTRITGGPEGLINEPAPTFTFIGSVPRGSFQCRLDGGTWYACTTPHRTRTVIDGEHTFAVRALDGGLLDPEPATRTFRVDTAAPSTTIVSGPKALSSDRSPVFVLASDDPDAALECKLDDGDWAPCGARWELHDLADGTYRASVRARDRAGNLDVTPATRTFTIDTIAPETLLTATLAAAPAPPAGMGTSTFAVSPSGVASMGVSCPAGAPTPCDGELAIDREVAGAAAARAAAGSLARAAAAALGTRSALARAAAARTIPVARASYSVPPGQTRTVAVTLPDAARWLLERSGRMAVIVRLTPRRGSAVRRPVMLRTDPSQPRFLDAGLNVTVKHGVAKLRVRCAKRCKGTVTLARNGKRIGKAAIHNGTVKVRVKRAGAAVVKFKTKRVAVTLTSGGTR